MCEPLVAHAIEKVAVPTETGSLNVISTFASCRDVGAAVVRATCR